MPSDQRREPSFGPSDRPRPADPGSGAASPPAVDRSTVAALHHRVLSELAAAGDWWDGASRRAIMEEARAARRCVRCLEHPSPSESTSGRHAGTRLLPAAAVEVIHRVVNASNRLTRPWAEVQIGDLGDGPYAEVVGVTATVVAADVYSRSIGDPPHELPPSVDGPPSAERPNGVGDVGAWIAMSEEKLMANVTRALSLVPRTNATWRSLVNDSYSRGPQMLELTWERALSRPQVELIAAQVSKLQECFY